MANSTREQRESLGVLAQFPQLHAADLVAVHLVGPIKDAHGAGVPVGLREAKILTQLSHPNVVQVLEAGQHEGQPFFIMELVTGGSLAQLLAVFVEQHGLGIVAGADGMLRLAPGRVRIPDVSFVSWDRLPQRRVPRQPIPDLVPDLAVEVLSEGNTPREMEQKLQEYFTAGVRLVWYVDPVRQEVRVYTAPDQHEVLTADHTLHGGEVLPGFTLLVRQLFAEPTTSPDHDQAL